jgi:hypothetical protein
MARILESLLKKLFNHCDHQWELEYKDFPMVDNFELPTLYWDVDIYKCTKCGKESYANIRNQ